MSLIPVIVGIFAGLAVAWLLWRPFFGDMDGFMECLRFWATPDVVSAYRGERTEDWMATMKLVLWLACVGGAAVAVWYGLGRLFG
jgi:hypothetical protein